MESRVTGNCHARFGAGENLEITSKSYLSLLPRFENIENMVTVARSRGIRFLFVLQSYSQLNSKYGREVGDIIKTNCNVKIFIGSDDSETRKEFSELCGQKKIKSFSVNTSAENPASSSTGASNQPLITVGMLERLNGDEKGDAIVSVRGYEPIWTKFTPSYELAEAYYPEGKADMSKKEAVLFDKDYYLFDILGETSTSKTDSMIEEQDKIESKEKEREENERGAKLKKVAEEWDKTEQELKKVIDKISHYLIGKDEKALKEAAYENKARILLMLTPEYNDTIAQNLKETANRISTELLPKMAQYQNEAKRLQEGEESEKKK